jgi:hypothetical protein
MTTDIQIANSPLYLQSRFWLGIICAIIFGGYGLFSIATLHTFIYGGRLTLEELWGVDACLAGVVYIMDGAFFHFNYYWRQSEKLYEHAILWTYLSLIIGGIFRFLLFWRLLGSPVVALGTFVIVWAVMMIIRED